MGKIICTFGDSIMKGVVSSEKNTDGKPLYRVSDNNFINRLGRQFGISVKNFACFGSTTTQGVKHIDRHKDDVAESDCIMLEYGGNDCDYNWKEVSENPYVTHIPKNPVDIFVSQYSALIQKIRSMNGNPIIMSLPLIDPDRFFEYLSAGLNRDNILAWLGGRTMHLYQWHEMYNVELFKMSRRLQVPIIDITTPFWSFETTATFFATTESIPTKKATPLLPKPSKLKIYSGF